MYKTKLSLKSLQINKIFSNSEDNFSAPTEDSFSTEDASSITPVSDQKLSENSISLKKDFQKP